MRQKFYVASIYMFDAVRWPWGDAIISYDDAEKFDKIFARWRYNKLIGVYKCIMPIVGDGFAYGSEIFIAQFLDNAERAAASTNLAALKSLLANCSLDCIIDEVEVEVKAKQLSARLNS